jgi:hypothetical protein
MCTYKIKGRVKKRKEQKNQTPKRKEEERG